MLNKPTDHIVKAFDEDLKRLNNVIAEMGGLAEAQLSRAVESLVRRNSELATQVVQDDKRIDALETEVGQMTVRMLALRQPMAQDLREVVAAIKIASDIERIGDYAKNIARRVPLLEDSSQIEPLSLLPEMARIASQMVHDVLDAFVNRDAEAAVRVVERDQAVDDFYDSIFRTLLTFMMEKPQTIGQSAHLLFVAKNLERVGDHATNIAEMVYYAATGEHVAEHKKGAHERDR